MFRKISLLALTLTILSASLCSSHASVAVLKKSAAVVMGHASDAPNVYVSINATQYFYNGALVGQYAFNSVIDQSNPNNTIYLAGPSFQAANGVYHSWGRTMYKGVWGQMDIWADASNRRFMVTFKCDNSFSNATIVSGTVEQGATFMIGL